MQINRVTSPTSMQTKKNTVVNLCRQNYLVENGFKSEVIDLKFFENARSTIRMLAMKGLSEEIAYIQLLHIFNVSFSCKIWRFKGLKALLSSTSQIPNISFIIEIIWH